MLQCRFLSIQMLFFIHAHHNMVQERELHDLRNEPNDGDDFYDAEILDEMTTHRGELKLRTSSFKEDKLYQARDLVSFYFMLYFFFVFINKQKMKREKEEGNDRIWLALTGTSTG